MANAWNDAWGGDSGAWLTAWGEDGGTPSPSTTTFPSAIRIGISIGLSIALVFITS